MTRWESFKFWDLVCLILDILRYFVVQSEWREVYDSPHLFNTLRPRENGRHFADDTFTRIFLNENVGISIKISLKFVDGGPINTIPALAQMMAWRRSGDKPLSEPMVTSSLTHICVTRPQWVNEWLFGRSDHLIAARDAQCRWGPVDFYGSAFNE